MRKDWPRWMAAAIFFILALIQIFRWGTLQLPIQGPIFLIFALGLVVAVYRDSLPMRNHVLFICSYAAVFLLLWAVGHPQIELVPGRTWLVTLSASVALGVTLLWNLRGSRGWLWFLALGVSMAFGLFIAFASGRRGGADWMQALVMRVMNLPPEEWRTAHTIVVAFRKCMHFVGYGSAALATAIAARHSGTSLPRSILFGFSWAIPLAVFDEWQQRYAPNRTSRPQDVLIDIAGMLTFLAAYWLYERRRQKKT